MKYVRLTAVFVFLCLLLCSCKALRYIGSYAPSELASTLRGEISALSDYREYAADDVKLMLDTDDAEAFSVMYSPDGDDIGEVGIFRVRDDEDTDEMLNEIREYIKNVRISRTSFVRSYIPEEMPKLEGANVTVLGRYVCYCILDKEEAKNVFDRLKVILME